MERHYIFLSNTAWTVDISNLAFFKISKTILEGLEHWNWPETLQNGFRTRFWASKPLRKHENSFISVENHTNFHEKCDFWNVWTDPESHTVSCSRLIWPGTAGIPGLSANSIPIPGLFIPGKFCERSSHSRQTTYCSRLFDLIWCLLCYESNLRLTPTLDRPRAK